MRINRIKIDKFGVIQDINLELQSGINVIFGLNESGKSLTMDFLLKKLSKKPDVEYRRSERVKEKPEGFITFFDEEEIKLESNQCLSDYYKKVKDIDVGRIFVMKDSDLNIPDGVYYADITDRLTGLRTNDIEQIKEGILEYGCLTTSNQEISSSQKNNYLKTRFNDAILLKEEIENYINRKDIRDLEGQLFGLKSKIGKKGDKLDKQKLAKKKHDYKINEDAIDSIIESKKELEELPNIELLRELETEIEEYEEEERKTDNYFKIYKFSKWSIYPAFLFSLLYWIVWFFTSQPIIGIITPVATSFFLLVFTIFWFIAFVRLKTIDELKEKLKQSANNLKLDSEKIDELKDSLLSIKENINEHKRTITDSITILKLNLKLDGSDDSVFIQAKTMIEEINFDEIKTIKTKYNQSKEEKLEEEIKELRNSIESISSKLQEHNRKLLEFSKKSRNLKMELELDEDLDLEIVNLDSLVILIEKIDEFIQFIEKRTINCKNAFNLFESIYEEEKTRINQLFKEDSTCIQLFQELTNGKYIDMRFDSESGKIIVKKVSGVEIEAENLSEGAYDQLYFAIRIDIAQKLLEENSGFLIMDDIFLSYDENRLEEAFEILKNLADKDWQIIYFTAKKEICELFPKMSDNELIVLNQLD